MEKKDFYEQIESNKRNSWILMIFVILTLGILTVVISGAVGANFDLGVMFIFFAFMSVFNIVYILYTYYHSDSVALKSVGAYKAEGDRYKQYRNIVEEMSIAGGLPVPRIYVTNSADINAFATGRDPEHAAICVTEGALAKLSREEIKAVIGHEMTHIRNYDIRFVTFVAVMVGLISIISQVYLRSLFWGGGGRDRRGGGNAALMILGLALAILAPVVVKLVQLAISRKREYMADAGAVELTRYPKGMADALRKIEVDYAQPRQHTEVNSAVAPMYLALPSKNMFSGIFATHPPIKDRIKALEAM